MVFKQLCSHRENMRMASCWISSSHSMWTLSVRFMNSLVLSRNICRRDCSEDATRFMAAA